MNDYDVIVIDGSQQLPETAFWESAAV